MSKERSKPIEVGDYVDYVPFPGCDVEQIKRGRVKSIQDSNHYFVVYNCNNEWNNYKNYTAQRTHINNIL